MVRRFLAWTLSACMLLNTAQTTVCYAAETETAVESSTQTDAAEEEDAQEINETESLMQGDTAESSAEEEDSEGDTADDATGEEALEEDLAEDAAYEEAIEESRSSILSETDEVTVTEELSLEEETELVLESGSTKWYSFTAPEGGYYSIDVSSASGYLNMNLYGSLSGSTIDQESIYSNSAGSLLTGEMEAGETLYVRAYSYSGEGTARTLTVRTLTEIAWETQSDGSYLARSDSYRIRLTPEAGYANIRYTVAMEASDGSSLDSSYTIVCLYNEQGGSSGKINATLYSYNNYLYTGSFYAGSDATCELSFALKGSSGNAVAAFVGELAFTTAGSTEDAVYIHDTQRTETSITMDVEIVDSEVSCCYYAPTDRPEEVDYQYISNGWTAYTFTALQPDTEYEFQFVNNNGKVLYTTAVSTAESDVRVSYTSSIAEDCNSLTLTANLSGYAEDSSSAYLHYEFTDALGQTKTDYMRGTLTDGGWDQKSFTLSAPFAAEESYDITLWVTIGSITGTKWGETVQTVTAPAASASDVTLTVTAEENTSGTANYTVTGAGDNTAAHLYYRQQGSLAEYSYNGLTLSDGGTSGFVSGLEAGMTYDFILSVGGVLRQETVGLAAGALSLTQVEDGTQEVNAFDIVRTLQLNNTDESDNSTYYLRLYCWNGSSYTSIGYTTLSTDNSYQVTFKTADYSKWLLPDTEYHLKWTVSTYLNATPSCTMYETIHTAAGFSVESGTGTGTTQSFTVSLENVGNITGYVSLDAYIKKKSAASYLTSQGVYLSSSNDYSTTATFSGLEAETDYEISWRMYTFSGSYEELATTEFTTTKDNRQIAVTGINAKPHSVTVSYSCTGGSSSYSSNEYFLLYIREQGDGNTWERVHYASFYNHSGSIYVYDYNEEELKEGTTYEYTIGIGDTYDTKVNRLEKTTTGTFRTAEDSRALSGIGVSARYTSAVITGLCTGSSSDIYSYIHLFLREKGEDSWSTHTYEFTTSGSYSFSRTFTGLTAGTDYEYAVVISDRYSCSGPEEVMAADHKQTGEFTTLACEYTLELETEKVTTDSAVLSVRAKGSTADTRLQVELNLSDGQSKTVILKQSAAYQKSVTFSGLEGSSEYRVTGAVISVFVDGSYEEIGTFECNYTFTTAAPIVPTGITLSKEAVVLNAAYAGYSVKEGYNGVTLTVTAAAPTDAAKDVMWKSSDSGVASVDANGKVTAVSVGTATITAVSRYAEEVTASCEVTVANYVIGQEIDGSVTTIDPYAYRALYKNGTASGYGLYDQSQGELTMVSDPTVTFSRADIVSWDNGTLTGITNGTVYVTMEKDGVKAGCYVTVSQEAKGFGITGFTTSSDYPAQETETGYLLAYAEDGGITYTAQGELSPAGTFAAEDFTWESSDENVAVVSAYGVVTPKSAGTVTLTVTPNIYSYSDGKYKQDKAEIVLIIKNTPTVEAEAVYALANVSGTIGDVDIEAVLGTGWSWKYPKTPLVTNGINTASYPFEAVYTGDAYYPEERTVDVYIGKITGVTVSETGADHNQVLETGGEDSLTLSVRPIYQGTLNSSLYTVEQEVKGGLTVDGGNGTYTVTADKAGSHTVTFTVKAGGKKLAQTVYKIKAVEGAQVRGITVTSGTDGVTVTDNQVVFDVSDAKQFQLQATAVDRNGNAIDTKLQWKSSDKKVASVAASGKDTHTAVVTTKGEGHTVITVTAKDDMGYEVELDVEIRNHAPRVDVSKATVNIAYDYDNFYGKQYAASAGCVEVVPVYGESVSSLELLSQGGTAETNLKAVWYSGYKYLIQPMQEEIPTGTYNCTLRVTTTQGTAYEYPMKVSVVDKAPTVSAKMSSAPNLFYLTSTGTISLSISGGYRVNTSAVTWQDQDEGINNGFAMSGYNTYSNNKYVSYITVSQQDIRMANGKLTDAQIATGTLSLKVLGFRKTYTFGNFKIKYTYKKPVLTTKNASTTVVPSIGLNSNYFYVYNKTDKTYMYYSGYSYKYYYDELECSSDTVTVTANYNRVQYTYSGGAKSEKITLTLGSANWREDLQVSHTVKAVQSKAYLANSQLTYNTVSKSTADTYIYIKNAYGSPSLADVRIQGSNAKAQGLLDDNLLTVSWDGSNNYVSVTQNRLDILEEKIPNGTYSYKLTPYYINADTGEKTALNTLTLKVKVTDKAISVKAGAKGTLDLTNEESYSGYNRPNAKNVVIVDPRLLNAGTGYYISDYKLVGEYSEYFTLTYGYIYGSGYHRYITIKDAGKLKAKQSYKLAIECTVQAPNGGSFTVTSNTFTIKPKQTAAKIKVSNNNQTMYAGADNLTRTYTLSTTSSDYIITSVYGSLDCNKDGIADIVVSGSDSYPTVTITDRDGVSASATGKVLSIPVTVRLKGRDGISVDAKTTIKVKVKR